MKAVDEYHSNRNLAPIAGEPLVGAKLADAAVLELEGDMRSVIIIAKRHISPGDWQSFCDDLWATMGVDFAARYISTRCDEYVPAER